MRTALLKLTDATLGSLLCRVLGRLHHLRHGDPASVDPTTLGPPRRLLVIRPGGLGDMLLLLPLLRAWQQSNPGTAIDLVCEQRNVEAVQLAGLTVNILPYDRQPFRLLRTLRRQPYDIAIDSEQFHHFSAIFALLSRAPVRIGFNINPVRNPLYTHLVPYSPDGAESAQFRRLFIPLGFTSVAGPQTVLEEAPVGGHALLPSRPFLALHTGASTPYKQWPEERWVELILRAHRERGLATVILGGGAEHEAADRIAAAVVREAGEAADPCVLAGSTTLAETAAILRKAVTFVGPDSGLAHLAIALDRPTAVLFGPSDPKKWGVEGPRHRIVCKGLPCAPCFIFGYHRPCRRRACMEAITGADVWDAVQAVCPR